MMNALVSVPVEGVVLQSADTVLTRNLFLLRGVLLNLLTHCV